MAFDVPKDQKVYTTVYDNFKGVDYTNDATNVYKRRTPTGYNMIPDLDGKPRKRRGWETVVGNEEFENAYQSFLMKYRDVTEEELPQLPANFKIYKVHYFELCGCDHMIIFTNIGLYVRYVVDEEDARYDVFRFLTDEPVLRTAYNRTFFFEANGETGFYIYSKLRIWKYYYNEDNDYFLLREQDPYVPTLRISTTADGRSGTLLDSYNLLGSQVREEFQNNNYMYISTSGTDGSNYGFTTTNCTATLDRSVFLAKDSSYGSHHFKYNITDDVWTDDNGDTVSMDTYGIKVTQASADARIRVRVSMYYRTVLTNEVAVTEVAKGTVKVWISDNAKRGQFGTQLTVLSAVPDGDSKNLRDNECALVTVDGVSHIQFGRILSPLVEGEDAIRVEYPCRIYNETRYPSSASTYFTSSINAEFDLRGLV